MTDAMQLTINETERALLERMLSSALGDIRVEARRTEFSSKMHDNLHEEQHVIEQLLERLKQG